MNTNSAIRLLMLLAICFFLTLDVAANQPAKIKVSDLRDKIAAAWVGQMIGNIYGLPHEGKYINAPGPENWPYGYTKNLDKLINPSTLQMVKKRLQSEILDWGGLGRSRGGHEQHVTVSHRAGSQSHQRLRGEGGQICWLLRRC